MSIGVAGYRAQAPATNTRAAATSSLPVLLWPFLDPGVTVEGHPAAPLAGMGKSVPSCRVEINRVFQPPPELEMAGISSRRLTHHLHILEFDVPIYRTDAAQKQEVNRQI